MQSITYLQPLSILASQHALENQSNSNAGKAETPAVGTSSAHEIEQLATPFTCAAQALNGAFDLSYMSIVQKQSRCTSMLSQESWRGAPSCLPRYANDSIPHLMQKLWEENCLTICSRLSMFFCQPSASAKIPCQTYGHDNSYHSGSQHAKAAIAYIHH